MIRFATRPLLAGALLCLNLSAGAATPAAAAPVRFDLTPRPGQHERQQMDMQMGMTMSVAPSPEATEEQRAKIAQGAERLKQMGPMKMTLQMQQTKLVGQPDAAGWLPLTISTRAGIGQIEVGGKVNPIPRPQAADLDLHARFNPKDFSFELQQVEGTPALGEAFRTQASATISEAMKLNKALAQRTLKPGDTVDIPLAMNLPLPIPGGANSVQGLVHYKLLKVERGVAQFELSMDFKADAEAPMPTPPAAAASAASAAASAASAPETPAAPQTMRIHMQGAGQGTSSLRLADGLHLASRMDMNLQATVDMPDRAVMSMDVDMVMQSKGESLAKAPAAKKKP